MSRLDLQASREAADRQARLIAEVEERRKLRTFTVGLGAVAVAAIAGILIRAALGAAPLAAGKTVEGNTRPLGLALFTHYLLPFEVLSVLLLVAMVGVILLSKKELK